MALMMNWTKLSTSSKLMHLLIFIFKSSKIQGCKTSSSGSSHMCESGNEQSPVNIIEKDCITKDYQPLTFLDDLLFTNDVLFENNRDTVKITLANTSLRVRVTGGALDSNIEYLVDNVHFHWASREVYGCEHTIDGERFPMEAHLVLYRSTEKDFDSALANNQTAVVSKLFENIETNFTNNALQGAIDSVALVKHPSSVKASGSVLSFLKDNIGGGFYSYMGSLTTVPCTEGVRWMVMKRRVPIGSSQLAVFHDVVGDDEIELHNWRNICPLNRRLLWQSIH